IEQGKVDVLLQSSARDRRVIFEEAAGISRFKMRKLEAFRRLERVEQNLLRLHDIVDEVENRLRSVRAQAGKARRYKEYYDRLQELRTQVALGDWRRLSERLNVFDREILLLTQQRDGALASVESGEARLLEIEIRFKEINEEIRGSEGRIAADRERIAALESSIEHERTRLGDLEGEIVRYQRQMLSMNARKVDLEVEQNATLQQRDAAQAQQQQITRRLVEAERRLTELIAVLDQLRNENQQRLATYTQQMRSSAALGNENAALDAQLAAVLETTQRCVERLQEVDRGADVLQTEIAGFHDQLSRTAAQEHECLERVAAVSEEVKQLQQQQSAHRQELIVLGQRQASAAERASVLEELVRNQDGLSAGVKEVLARASSQDDKSFRDVFTVVADLFVVSLEAAPLVEIALGHYAQFVAARRNERLIGYLQQQGARLAGRVGFLWLDAAKEDTSDKLPNLEGQPGVLGRADNFVETQPQFIPLARRLLSRTWFVENLAQAMSLSEGMGKGLNYVTLSGELLQADRTLTVGPRQGSTGLISRRSELRALSSQMEDLQNTVAASESVAAALDDKIVARGEVVARLQREAKEIAEKLAESRLSLSAAEERRIQLDQQRAALETELAAAEAQQDFASQRLSESKEKRKAIEQELAETEQVLKNLAEKIDELDKQRLSHGRETTEIKVELAMSEERLRNLEERLRQLDEIGQERVGEIDETRKQLDESIKRAQSARWSILRAESEIAELFLRKDSAGAQTTRFVNQREEIQEQRNELGGEVQKIRSKLRGFEEKLHIQELSSGQLRHERTSLADRFREDYGLELAELEQENSPHEKHQREEVQGEIDDLRRKIANLGNVNLEALEEIEQFEARYKTLSEQYEDLCAAKEALQRIIEKINTDSRRLFSETLALIREHFQRLFRDLFGGGQADIVLEEGVDILETGIEIVARPPGKEPRSIS
ncbi:MAG: hypothetical protein ACWGMZ_09095, partial [Thermoguttaceae bacterium]